MSKGYPEFSQESALGKTGSEKITTSNALQKQKFVPDSAVSHKLVHIAVGVLAGCSAPGYEASGVEQWANTLYFQLDKHQG